MNILFLTMNPFTSIDMHNIYSDLMKVFVANGHRPYIVTPRERKSGEKTEILDYKQYAILKVRIGNTSNVCFIEKGISTVLLEYQFKRAIDRYLSRIHFDLVLYSTPPITLAGVVKSLKKKYRARTYLMLKDIFPQNAIDMGLFSAAGLIAWYFKRKEKRLYKLSDRIGCMSPANVDYLLSHNPEVSKEKVDILPNAIIPNPLIDRTKDKQSVKQRFGIPQEAITILFGGNLGKPQGIPSLIQCLHSVRSRKDFYFIVCGSGSDFHLLEEYKESVHPVNLSLVEFLPKKEYDELVRGCDVGLIFLDHRFTIPNFPSRILTYMENAAPVICATDPNTDIGKMVEENGFGFACESNSIDGFVTCLEKIKASDLDLLGAKARKACEELYSADNCYCTIVNSCS